MKRYQQKEVTTAVVTTITTIHARSPEDAQAAFDDGSWETRVEEVGDVIGLHSTELTEIPENWAGGGQGDPHEKDRTSRVGARDSGNA